MRSFVAAGFLLVACLSTVSCRDEWDDFFKAFYRSESNLKKVPRDIPDEAKEVYLNHNDISYIKANAFSNLKQCLKIYLDFNSIVKVKRGAFAGLVNIEYLYLNNNEMVAIMSYMFKGLKKLRYLKLSNNRISIIQKGTFARLKSVESLSLNGNQLTGLDMDMWDGLDSLKDLYLEDNLISAIESGTFGVLPGLENLNLENNQLTTFLRNVFISNQTPKGKPTNPVNLWLGGNPMQCDCRMCWLKKAEKKGWVSFNFGFQYPDCENKFGELWDTLELDCDKSDPEQAQRCQNQIMQAMIEKLP